MDLGDTEVAAMSTAADLDHSGLIERIEAVIAPPVLNPKAMKKRPMEYRKPRAVNSDVCHFCDEPGDLVCCDECPASFHLKCHNPPLNEEDVPLQEKWKCHRCSFTLNKPLLAIPDCDCPEESGCSPESHFLTERLGPCKPKDSGKASTKVNGLPTIPGQYCLGNTWKGCSWMPVPNKGLYIKASCGSKSDKSGATPGDVKGASSEEQRNLQAAYHRVKEFVGSCNLHEVNPWWLLARSAESLNSSQFQLPDYILPDIRLPGSEDVSERSIRGCVGRGASFEKADNGLIPRPAKLCAVCYRCCLNGFMIQCDYCSLVFHLDCLDPPLPAPPATRWLCPNHPQHMLDKKFLTSLSCSARLNLWKRFGLQPVDPGSVELEFLKKAKKRAPPYRYRRFVPPKIRRTKVPGCIKSQYKNPVSQLPSVSANEFVQSFISCADKADIRKAIAQLSKLVSYSDSPPTCDKDAPQDEGIVIDSTPGPSTSSVSPDQRQYNLEQLLSAASILDEVEASKKILASDPKDLSIPHVNGSSSPLNNNGPVPGTSSFGQLQTSSVLSANGGKIPEPNGPRPKRMLVVLPSSGKGHILRENGLQGKICATTKIIQPKSDCDPIVLNGHLSSSTNSTRYTLELANGQKLLDLSETGATIGSGEKCTLNTSKYVKCPDISDVHATILFNRKLNRFELVNQSELGSVVNDILYLKKQKPNSSAQQNHSVPLQNGHALDQEIKDYISTERKKRKVESKPPIDNVDTKGACARCSDFMWSKKELGCPERAVLRHKSHVRIGCFEFNVLQRTHHKTSNCVKNGKDVQVQ